MDASAVYTNEKLVDSVKLPMKEFRTLRDKLIRATACISKRPDPDLEHVDAAFMNAIIDPEEEDMIQGVCDIEVRDAFLEFMSKTLSDYKKFFKDIHTA